MQRRFALADLARQPQALRLRGQVRGDGNDLPVPGEFPLAAAQASALRELMYTRAPASSRPRAIMSPMPRLPPVTTAVFPDRSNKSMISPIQNPASTGSQRR